MAQRDKTKGQYFNKKKKLTVLNDFEYIIFLWHRLSVFVNTNSSRIEGGGRGR